MNVVQDTDPSSSSESPEERGTSNSNDTGALDIEIAKLEHKLLEVRTKIEDAKTRKRLHKGKNKEEYDRADLEHMRLGKERQAIYGKIKYRERKRKLGEGSVSSPFSKEERERVISELTNEKYQINKSINSARLDIAMEKEPNEADKELCLLLTRRDRVNQKLLYHKRKIESSF